MTNSIWSQLSDEDHQLIEINQLGIPSDIYNLKPGPIRILYGITLFLFVIGTIMLTSTIFSIFVGWHKTRAGGNLVAAMLISLSVLSLLIGLFLLRIGIPNTRSERLVVCEQGLLLIKKKIRSTHVEALHWSDILAIKRDLLRIHYIVTLGGKAFSLFAYQNADELVDLIRRRSGVI